MSYFNKKSFTMRQVIGLLTIVFLGISAITYAVSFTDFTSGTTISSSEMNTKLNALKDAINKKDIHTLDMYFVKGSRKRDEFFFWEAAGRFPYFQSRDSRF
jgi:hypothetical protein